MISIRRSFSTKLSLGILLLAIPIFILSLGILFNQSRHMIRRDAVGRANSVLSATMHQLSRKLASVENATNANCWLVAQDLLRIIVLGLLGQFAAYLGLIQLVIDTLYKYTVFLGKVATEHHVNFVNDVRKQVALVVWAITSSRLRC